MDSPETPVEYTASDISPLLARRLVDTLGSDSVQAKGFDISKPPHHQDIAADYFDLIVGLHVIHAAPDMKQTLKYLNSTLRPGGRLLAIEPDGSIFANGSIAPGATWFDFVFGPFWFGYTDERNHCTLTAGEWKEALYASGFGQFEAATDGSITLVLSAVKET